ncbi:DNA-binding transcriptional LysR family regulator [Streptomyces sp. SAI-144]|jgi:DNA-binding transcriptional LysR family regulator|uniref:LysR family transcriptional regulator n=1 Tax=Streptomyces sp. SAI-144 TaxID=2940544 RepID=UPI0024735AB9|nr:LysR family transcriptional regulator [Streptomyces sp. SAI-144]MDH6435985.1 DNA-binding transcriptional LysR family regulator [Streptomyces sp. SAI-144]
MELRELRAFVAVAEEGGLSAAARRLHMSQPALSQTISGLERQLGVKLLVRGSTGVRATDAASTGCGPRTRGGPCWGRRVPSLHGTIRPCG